MRGRRGQLVAIALMVSVSAGCGESGADDPPAVPSATSSPSASASAAIFPYSDEDVGIDAGTYRIPRSAWSVADFTVTFGEGWTVQYGHVFHRPSDSPYGLEFYAVVPDAIYADGCQGMDGDLMQVGPSVDDFATALLAQPGATKGDPVATTLGGYPATRIDLAVPDGFDLEACSLGEIGLQIWYSPDADKYFVLLNDNPTSVYIVDVGGQRQVFIAGPVGPSTTSRDARELQSVLDSIRIGA
jgi:hypothetical protein